MERDDDKRSPALVDRGEAAPRPARTRARLLQPWLHLRDQLVPLIGETGFCALFGRAVRVSGPAGSWLSAHASCRSPEVLFSQLAEDLAALDDGTAAEANVQLLNTFTKLLSALIGEALTTRLLASAVPGEDGQDRGQEHK